MHPQASPPGPGTLPGQGCPATWLLPETCQVPACHAAPRPHTPHASGGLLKHAAGKGVQSATNMCAVVEGVSTHAVAKACKQQPSARRAGASLGRERTVLHLIPTSYMLKDVSQIMLQAHVKSVMFNEAERSWRKEPGVDMACGHGMQNSGQQDKAQLSCSQAQRQIVIRTPSSSLPVGIACLKTMRIMPSSYHTGNLRSLRLRSSPQCCSLYVRHLAVPKAWQGQD